MTRCETDACGLRFVKGRFRGRLSLAIVLESGSELSEVNRAWLDSAQLLEKPRGLGSHFD